jgi:hypothetical protein
MRYESKQALWDDIVREHDSLCAQLDDIPSGRWQEPGGWGDGWTVADLVAHLAEWQRMFLSWHEDGLKGVKPALPAAGYKWSELPRLNRAIQEKHRGQRRGEVRADFEAGYRRILALVGSLSEEQILEPGHFAWTGRNPLRTYLGGNTSSHYRFAAKVLRRWLRATSSPRR